MPQKFSESLFLAAQLQEKVEAYEETIAELMRYKDEVLRPVDIVRVCKVSKTVVSEWTRDPSFPVLNSNRKKYETVMVLKDDLFNWLKNGQLEAG